MGYLFTVFIYLFICNIYLLVPSFIAPETLCVYSLSAKVSPFLKPKQPKEAPGTPAGVRASPWARLKALGVDFSWKLSPKCLKDTELGWGALRV